MKYKSNTIFLGVIAALLGLMTGCESPETGKLRVFVSILPQKFIVERIGRDRVDISVMTGPGQSPATYEPLPQQMIDLAEAAVYFRIGIPFEQAWMKKIQSINPGMKIIDTRYGITLREMDSFNEIQHIIEKGLSSVESQNHEHKHDKKGDIHNHVGKDPHVWLSPESMKIQANTVFETLTGLDSENRAFYKSNLDTLIEDLDLLSAELERAFVSLPVKKMLVFHPAWGYFADRFGLVQIPIEIEGKEPGLGQLSKIIAFAKNENIRVVFVQSQFSTKSAEVIAKEINGAVVTIDPLAENYIENLRNAAKTIIRNIK